MPTVVTGCWRLDPLQRPPGGSRLRGSRLSSTLRPQPRPSRPHTRTKPCTLRLLMPPHDLASTTADHSSETRKGRWPAICSDAAPPAISSHVALAERCNLGPQLRGCQDQSQQSRESLCVFVGVPRASSANMCSVSSSEELAKIGLPRAAVTYASASTGSQRYGKTCS